MSNTLRTLKGRSLLTLADLSSEEIFGLLDKAIELKKKQQEGIAHDDLKGKVLAMIFEKSSTRTRVSFEVGMIQLGGHALFLNKDDIQLGRGETVADTAKTLSRYVDGIMIRTYDHKSIEILAEYADVPVINALTDDFHPCQALADLMTLYEIKGDLKGKKLTYVGDGNNVAHSLMLGCAKTGVDCTVAVPSGYEPHANIIKMANEIAKKSGAEISVTNDPKTAVAHADAIYTDVWTSMGWEGEEQIRLKAFQPYQVNEDLMSHAKSDAVFMHCLPAIRGEEVTEGVIDGPQSVVFQEAENRLHVQKALLSSLMGD